jgi:hypothetical protein
MTTAVNADNGFLAFYIGRDHKWHIARDARGLPIVCETEALAQSVARYRRRRIKLWS